MAATSQMEAYRATDMFRIKDTKVIETFVKNPAQLVPAERISP
jgi:hypothetical protein